MILTQAFTDKTAISLSIICAVHCLILPSILILLPNFFSWQLDNELIHFWILVLVIPFSIFGLVTGLINHKKYIFLILGAIGIIILSLPFLVNEEILGVFGERFLTFLGSITVATAHFKNYRLCRHLDCDCH